MYLIFGKRKFDINKPIFKKNVYTKEQNEENAKLRRKLIKQEILTRELEKWDYQKVLKVY
jgi:hypothetical protein